MAKSPLPSKPITEHLAFLLAQANREINRQLDTRLRKEGVPVEQWRILKVLSDGKGHSMGDLAEAVLLNHPTLTKMIDRMVSDALVYRVQDTEDRRKVVMFSSDRGKALTQRLNSLALSQEDHIAESYGNKATAELKRLRHDLAAALAVLPSVQMLEARETRRVIATSLEMLANKRVDRPHRKHGNIPL